jgi:hypothetical protein
MKLAERFENLAFAAWILGAHMPLKLVVSLLLVVPFHFLYRFAPGHN